MKTSNLAVSLLGLALFVPGLPLAPSPLAAPAALAANQEVPFPPEVLRLLQDKRPLAQLSEPELQNRVRMAEQFAGDPSVPANLQGELKSIASAAKAELAARAQAAVPPPPPPPPAPAPKEQAIAPAEPAPVAKPQVVQSQPKLEAQPKVEAPPKIEAPAAPQLPQMVSQLLADNRPIQQLQFDELGKRIQIAQHFLGDPSISPDVKAQLQSVLESSNAEMARRQSATTGRANTQPQVAAAPPQPATPVQPPAKPIEKPVTAAPAPPPAVAEAPDPAKVKQLDNNPVDPAAEQKAKAYLADGTDITKLSDDDLRKRLDDVRELLAANDMSQDTERAVRAKLLKEREVLRTRMAQAEAAKQQQAAAQNPPPPQQQAGGNNGQQQTQTGRPQMGGGQQGQQQGQGGRPPALPAGTNLPPPPPPPPQIANVGGGINFNLSIGFISEATPPFQVLSDRRPPDELQASELQRRIQVYDDAVRDNRYDPAYRNYWRNSLDYNRAILRERLREERHQRAMDLNDGRDQFDFQMGAPPPRNMPHSVFAAEVDDQELQGVLTQAPMGDYQPRYRVQDIAGDPNLRNAIPRVDVDTVHFGYNEGFIREEELSHLDNIASIIERIVRKYPNEIFLIEGHTDAVGSDAYNLRLSKLRAESVKQMMTTYYVIPPQNLRTVGLGERFLKIPTADPEPENRRVSVARITPLLGYGQ